MADDSTSRFRAGQTALVITVPEAEPAVRAWRERYDPSARAGVPAHVTVLFPFLGESLVDMRVHEALADVFARHDAFDLRFGSCGRFPGVLFLAPEPDMQLRQLTEEISARWPEAPPYGGRFTDVVPHLTVADGPDETVLDEIEPALLTSLPITSRASSVDLMAHDGAKWQMRTSFPLRIPTPRVTGRMR